MSRSPRDQIIRGGVTEDWTPIASTIYGSDHRRTLALVKLERRLPLANVTLFDSEDIMTVVNAITNPIVVDKSAGQTSGSTTIKYEKEKSEEFWERTSVSSWSGPINLFGRVQTADADTKGQFPETLKPGIWYEAGIFVSGHGPLTTDPILQSSVKVFCVWQKPVETKLITDENRGFGGTWYFHQLHTKVATDIMIIGVSRSKPVLDSNGIPQLKSPEGKPTAPLANSNDHQVEINPLLPGTHFFFAAVVTDSAGNWEVKQDEFTTFRRQFTVQFPTIHIFNDGDPGSYGEGEFWFRVYFGGPRNQNVIQDFHMPTQDIDDWGETDRPYSVGFAHVGALKAVDAGQEEVWVSSWGVEHDGIFEPDERAHSRDTILGFPVGRNVENVPGGFLKLDCVTTSDDDFHYGVDVQWSVSYMA